ncbi:hypothetical protein GGI24_007149, partial [Coemansia furcata]
MSKMPHFADIMSSPREIEANISAFVRHIKKLAPLMKKVALTLTASIVDIPLFNEKHRGSLVKQICQLATNVEYNVYYQPTSVAVQPTGVCEMIISDKDGSDITELTMQLAQRNASTLQFLAITFCRLRDISPLIKDTEGRYIQYPRLYKLRIADSQGPGVLQRPSFPNAIPFP